MDVVTPEPLNGGSTYGLDPSGADWLAPPGQWRLTEAELVSLRERLLSLVRQAQDKPDDEGVWTRVVVTLVDLQDRGQPTSTGDPV